MNAEILKQLDHINQQFYQNYSKSFSQTRGKLQSGVSAILDQIPQTGNWLDIGCGNGNLAHAWVNKGLNGFYYGVDLSSGLIADAQKDLPSCKASQKVNFIQTDVAKEDWINGLPDVRWDGLFCFAVLHHIPGKERRAALCRQLMGLLPSGGNCYISVWQPKNSIRLAKRIQPWESVGLADEDVEPDDVLMDWRAHQSGSGEPQALRFVHIFTRDELSGLAADSGFTVQDTFLSDGKEGNLGLYQKWTVDFL